MALYKGLPLVVALLTPGECSCLKGIAPFYEELMLKACGCLTQCYIIFPGRVVTQMVER